MYCMSEQSDESVDFEARAVHTAALASSSLKEWGRRGGAAGPSQMKF